MYEKINWTIEDRFEVLTMMQVFTDEELQDLGMGAEDIKKFREYEKRAEEYKTNKSLQERKGQS